VANVPWRYYAVFLLCLGVLVLALALGRVLPGPTITINWNTTYQTIDGFGGSATGYTEAFSAAQADRFFNPTTGLGLSLLRVRVIADTVNADCGCVANSNPYTCIVGSGSQIVTGDLRIAQLAAARGVRVFAAPWSPPAEMKSSGSYCSSGSFVGNAANYAHYATALASFPALLNAYGLSIYAISVQNEPDIANPQYDTCTWTGQQIHDFIPYLSSALAAAGFGKIKIAVPEVCNWKFELMNMSMDDPGVAANVGLLLGHAYGVEKPSSIPSMNERHVWQTEVCDADAYDGSMRNAMKWARCIHNFMAAGANAWMYWNLDCGPRHYNESNNMCLTDQRGNFAKRAFVLGQYAKFVRAGWRRIDVTNSGSLLVTAYKGPGNEYAIVAINPSRWAARKQSFKLNGATSSRSQVMPWLTSATASLAPQSAVSLTSNGTIFTSVIPANSVVTFHGQLD